MTGFMGFGALVDGPALATLASRLALDLAVATIVIRLIYHRLHRNTEYVFTYYLFNLITFFLCHMLRQIPTPFGVGLALFGVFGILRYRTEQIQIRDLTYLFIVIGLGMLNAIADRTVSAAELLLMDAVIVGMTALLQLGMNGVAERSAPMFYDRIELLQPGSERELLADLEVRTGLKVVRVQVNQLDLLRDAAEVTIFYRPAR